MASDAQTPPVLTVESSPHVRQALTTRRVMIDVLVALVPAIVASVLFFRCNAAVLIVSCCVAGLATEALFNLARRKPNSLGDCSALITGVILALSLPPAFPWWGAVIGMVVAIALGKMVFGGLGHNIFNPAMVGRAFLMACFPALMTTWAAPVPLCGSGPCAPAGVCPGRGARAHAPVVAPATRAAATQAATTQTAATQTAATQAAATQAPATRAAGTQAAATQAVDAKAEATTKWKKPRKKADVVPADAVTQATPMQMIKERQKAKTLGAARAMPAPKLADTFFGRVGGCVGETSAVALLLGALYLLVRRTITIEIPLGILVTVILVASITHVLDPVRYADPLLHLTSGGLLLGAFFIATDPVTCPLPVGGRWLFGFGVGALVMLIRLVGGYPEGVMYAVLLMNAVTPLLNRWTRPTPLGGHVRA